jgi:hypothetical protein
MDKKIMLPTIGIRFGIRYAVVVAVVGILLSGCKDKSDKPPIHQKEKPVLTLKFKPVFNGKPLSLHQWYGPTAANDSLSFTRISFLMYDIVLEKDNGDIVALPDTVALMRLGDNRETLGFIKDVPAGTYSGLSFTIGLDSARNFGDPGQYGPLHPLNPLVNQLFWDWSGGYVFMAVEGHFSTEEPTGNTFTFHMATMAFRPRIKLPSPEPILLQDEKIVVIDVDMYHYFSTPNPFSLVSDGNSSHSTSEAGRKIMSILSSNLTHAFSISKIQ